MKPGIQRLTITTLCAALLTASTGTLADAGSSPAPDETGGHADHPAANPHHAAHHADMAHHPAAERIWDIRLSDLRLDRALQRWAQTAGYSFRWDADRYVVIGANARFTGPLEKALEAVLATPGIRASSYPLEACIYANQPPLIRITRMGDQGEDCL